MKGFLQKKLAFKDKINLPTLISADKIINTYATYKENDNFFKSKKKESFKTIIFNPTSNKKLKIELEGINNYVVDGGFLVLIIDKISIHPIELSGIMMYFGFKKVFQKKIEKLDYVVFQKLYEKSKIEFPSTKLIISLDRVGYKGKNIKIHKIRSMYKYSEFLHQDMLEKEGLSSIGKVNKDPRITPFGRFIRKYWIDEIPQIIDLLLGKIKLVGIRAMSHAFFSQYPDRYQKKYFQVKPGLICPIFDNKNPGFNEIVRIEEKYLDDYLSNPFKTDFKLFFKTLFMIFKGARSN